MGILSWIKPLKRYEDYVDRANAYENLFQMKKAIETMEMAIKQAFTIEERSSGLIYLGLLYSKMGKLPEASDCYHEAFDIMKDKDFRYSSNFNKMIETFIKNGDTERAKYWLDNFLQRQVYDKKFKKLTVLKR